MKKTLLFLSILSSVYYVSGQKANQQGTSTSTVCNVIPLGVAPNAFGSNGGNQRQLSYNKDINTVAFIHLSLCDSDQTHNANIGFNYDVSFDGGITWTTNEHTIYGPVSNPTPGCIGAGPHPGFDPVGMIYNPAGNTIPANAHLAYAGRLIGINGKLNGTGHFDLSAPDENYDPLQSKFTYPYDIFVAKTGESWMVGIMLAQPSGYQDTILIFKGTWNGSDFDYTSYPVQYVVNPVNAIGDMKIAFSDNGLIGYIAVITNQDINQVHFSDSCTYIQVLKTEDGGQTWSCPIDLDISRCLDSAMIGQGTDIYTATRNVDIAVDKNNNPHIVNTIVPSAGPGSIFISNQSGTYGLFDFYSTDQGTTWQAQLLAHPQTFSAEWGTFPIDDFREFISPFISRTWDGSKLFFGFFDTDTFPIPYYDNVKPDLRLIGYDVDNNTWTAPLNNLQAVNGGENITAGSSAQKMCTLGQGSYYAKDDGNTYSVPVVYTVMANSPSYPVAFYYIDCASPSGTFTYSGHPLPVPAYHFSPLCDSGSGVVLTAGELTSGLIVSSNYPNPFTGKTSVDITLEKAVDLKIEISNVVGQVLSTTTYQNLRPGLNTLTLDVSSLAHGLYFFTVKAGNSSVTKTMTVE